MSRPFRFGTMSMPFTPFAQLVEQAQAAEDAGFDLFLLPDFPGAVSPIATVAALAGHTSTLRFSPLVVNAGLWRPDLLVREFLSADQISAGRVEIGLGAGNAPGGPAKPLTHLREVGLAGQRRESAGLGVEAAGRDRRIGGQPAERRRGTGRHRRLGRALPATGRAGTRSYPVAVPGRDRGPDRSRPGRCR
jgi:hypothetical protein